MLPSRNNLTLSVTNQQTSLPQGYFACQLNRSEQFLKIFRLSRLCDGRQDCWQGSDELTDDLRYVFLNILLLLLLIPFFFLVLQFQYQS